MRQRFWQVVALVLFGTLLGSTSFASQGQGEDVRQRRYGKVELLRDGWGIPHVFAQTDLGALYGAGYACAQDRGFQMYYLLRIVQGRLAEVLGDTARMRKGQPATTVESDMRMRAFGFARSAREAVKHLDDETLAMLQAYCAGVNAYFAEPGAWQNPLFERLGLEREAWTPEACILSWWHMAQFFAKNGLNDTASLHPPSQQHRRGPQVGPDDEAAVVRREDVSEVWIQQVNDFVASHGLLPQTPKGPDTPDPKFSHAWVIGGTKTTTGSAVLVSDPQTPVWNPNMFYEAHLAGKTFNVRGMGVPGCPLILIGFSDKVAWGVTALGADQADLFLLKTDVNKPNQYEVDGEWLAMKVWEETITIKHGEARTVTLKETIFGPVMTPWVTRRPPGKELALARVPMAETDRETIQAMLPMFRSQSSKDFAAALPKWRFPTANCIFGDVTGTIGYWSLGAIPVRSAQSAHGGSVAQDGSSRTGTWQGMIPYDLLPHVFNPQRGYLVTANHRTIQSFYRMPFGNMTGAGGDTDRGLRIKERIAEYLTEHERFTPAAVLAIQDDCVNVWKREVVRLGIAMLVQEDRRLSGDATRALGYLEFWYRAGAAMDTRVRGTELAEKMSVIFRGGQYDIVARYGGGVSGLARFAKATRQRFTANPATEVTDDEAQFADRVLANAWRLCQRAYGDDPNQWSSQALKVAGAQSLAYMGTLDGFPGLDPNLNVPVPRLQTQDGGTILSQRAQAYTQYVPLHDVDAALSILPPGVSEDPASPFRFSMYADWARGVLHPAPLSRQAVEAIAVSARDLTGRSQQPRQALRQRPPSIRKPLPGRKPDDPTLEAAIRYLNRQERTAQEVEDKIEELRQYIHGHSDRKGELIEGLKLFTHLMRESQAGNMPIRYGTPEILKLIEAFYRELTE
ncbi:penicillin acylase family protein [Planctomycetota bacterium]